jgi:hypothetical protein
VRDFLRKLKIEDVKEALVQGFPQEVTVEVAKAKLS